MGVIFDYQGYQLSDIEIGDAQELFERFTSQPHVMRYLPIKVHTYVEQAEALIADYRQLRRVGIRIAAIRHQSSPRLVGTIGASQSGHAIALSMKIAPDRYSMGAGCIVAPQFVHWLLAHEPIKRVWAYTDIDNKGVANLLRKMNACCEGLMRKYAVHPNISEEPRDCLLWSIVK